MSVWTIVTSVARGVLQDALAGRPPSRFINQLARTNIERARAELRLGEPAAGDALLRSTLERLKSLTPDGATDVQRAANRDVLRGVAYSVLGQGLERQGRRDEAAQLYKRTVELISRVPDESMMPRDRSDYGVALAALGANDDARKHLERAREEKGETSEATRHLARILLDAGRETATAERLLTEALQVTPSDPDANELMGRALAQRGHPNASNTLQQAAYLLLEAGRIDDARRVLDGLRDLTKNPQEVLELHAEALRLGGRALEAVAEFEEALAGEPDSPWLWGRYASALLDLDRIDEAAVAVDRAAQQAPEDAVILVLSGQIALRRSELDDALAFSERALDADPREPTAHALRARAEQARGSGQAALDAVRAGQALAPQDRGLLHLHAQLERSEGDPAAAIDLLRAVCNLPSASPADYWALADALAAGDELDKALETVIEARARWSMDDGLVELHGDLLRRGGRSAQSVDVLREATVRDPKSARAQLLLALALHQSDPDSSSAAEAALAALATSAQLAPDWADPHWWSAQVLHDLDDRDGALAELEVALRLERHHPGASRLLGQIRLEERNPAAAQDVARELLSAHPGDLAGHLLLARAHLAQRRPRKVLSTLAATPPNESTDRDLLADWLALRGEAHARCEHWQAAHEDLTAALRLQDDRANVYLERAKVSRERGDGPGAVDDADAAIRLQPDNAEAWTVKGLALLTAGRAEEAKTVLREALRLDDANVPALQFLAQATAADDLDEARRLLGHAITLAPDDRQLQVEEAWLDLSAGEPQEALSRFDRLVGLAADAESQAGRAEALRLLGRPLEAVDAAEQALAITPADPQALRSLGYAKLAAGHASAAWDAFDEAHRLMPKDVRAKVDLAVAYATSAIDDLDRAFALLDEACVASPADPWALGQFAQLALEIGSYDDAARLFELALASDASDVASWYGLGWACQYDEPAQLDKALFAFEQALAASPGDHWVRKSVANVLHLRGDTDGATKLYHALLEETEPLRSERPDLLDVVGWCAFRLGRFTTASRALLEVVSATSEATTGDFDLALVLFCDPGSRHGVESYRKAVQALSKRHAYAQRGVLRVALTDFRQAMRDHPQVAQLDNAKVIEGLLVDTLSTLPAPPAATVLSAR